MYVLCGVCNNPMENNNDCLEVHLCCHMIHTGWVTSTLSVCHTKRHVGVLWSICMSWVHGMCNNPIENNNDCL